MAKKTLGIGSIEVNIKFKDSDEAFKYAKRLVEHIRYVCKKNAGKGWYAQAMVVVSNMKKDISRLSYDISGKRGRPRKRLDVDVNLAYKWYKGDYMTDYHLHVLIVSKPNQAFRNEVKDYIDKNWIEKTNDCKKKIYKKDCNIEIAKYFIGQSEKILFCDCNFGEEEKLKYSLRNYYSEYLKKESQLRRLYRKNRMKHIEEDKYIKELNKIESKFDTISNYYLDITKEQDNKVAKKYMNNVRLGKIKENYNKEQNIHHNRLCDDSFKILKK